MVRAIYALTSLLGLAAAAPVAAPEAKPDLSDASNEVESGFQKFEHFFDARDPGLQSLEDGAKHAADNFASVFTGKDNSKRGFSFESMGQDIKNGVDNAAGDAKKAFTGSSKRDFSFESMGQDIKNGVDNAAGDAKKAFTGKNDKR